nr:hypothetical protein GCM10020092_078490 [Actinoplanes digitatis]
MDGDQHDDVLRGRPECPDAQERSGGEVERLPAVLVEPALDRRRRVVHGKRYRLRRGDHDRDVPAGGAERPPQDLMPPDDLVDAPAQGSKVQPSRDPERDRAVVVAAARVEPVDEPQLTLLR